VSGREALDQTYTRLLESLAAMPDEEGWRATRCAGWTVRDLVHHLLSDANRALVALHTPSAGPATADGVTYWSEWQPQARTGDQDLRATRIMASAWTRVRPLVDLYAETARAVLVAAGERTDAELVGTQGRVLTVDSLLRTLGVEATVHHLDLGVGEPGPRGLAEVRRVLDGLLGATAPIPDDVRYALVGTGREPLTIEERERLGSVAARFPLFG